MGWIEKKIVHTMSNCTPTKKPTHTEQITMHSEQELIPPFPH